MTSSSRDALPAGRAKLAAVMKMAGDIVRIEDAQQAIGVTRLQAAKLLSRWAAQGWLRRVEFWGIYRSETLE